MATAPCSRTARWPTITRWLAARSVCRPARRRCSEAYFFTSHEALATFEQTPGLEVGVGLESRSPDSRPGNLNRDPAEAGRRVRLGEPGLMAGAQVEGQKITKLGEKIENNG